jgi:hypothetical protein
MLDRMRQPAVLDAPDSLQQSCIGFCPSTLDQLSFFQTLYHTLTEDETQMRRLRRWLLSRIELSHSFAKEKVSPYRLKCPLFPGHVRKLNILNERLLMSTYPRAFG